MVATSFAYMPFSFFCVCWNSTTMCSVMTSDNLSWVFTFDGLRGCEGQKFFVSCGNSCGTRIRSFTPEIGPDWELTYVGCSYGSTWKSVEWRKIAIILHFFANFYKIFIHFWFFLDFVPLLKKYFLFWTFKITRKLEKMARNKIKIYRISGKFAKNPSKSWESGQKLGKSYNNS